MINISPIDTPEHADWEEWRKKSKTGQLKSIRSLACWSDICGVGNILAKQSWEMDSLINDGLFNILNDTYITLGKPFLVGVAPSPSERVLVINDGIARTIDIACPQAINHLLFIFYIRDIFMHHYLLEQNLCDKGLGLRSILAGGARCQYSQEKQTGHSVLNYSDKPSVYGKKILDQTFVYNPAEFQMNTAFAAAYTIDSAGTKYDIKPNRVYITNSWIDVLNFALEDSIKFENKDVDFSINGNIVLTIRIDKSMDLRIKGLNEIVHRVSEVIVRKALEGEETIFPMNTHDDWKS